jgi:TonB-dependent receptor
MLTQPNEIVKRKKTKAASLLCLFFLACSPLYLLAQQNGTLSGKIIDKATGEDLIGATVSVEGTNLATTSDFEGKYTLKLTPGTYNISCSYISFQKITVTGLKIESGKITTIDFTLEQKNTDLKEVIVEARQIKNTDASLIAIQRKAYAVQDGVSAQQISRTGSANAAETMKQMIGANVEDGKFMVMRGLGDRYSIAQINGLPMPSSDPYRNASSLDLIPSGFIDNIITVKSFTPDQPGNFAGGNVNITTKSFPEKFYLNLSVSQAYNTQSSLNGNFLTYKGGSADWRGYDDGYRAMPGQYQNDSVRNLLTTVLPFLARNNEEYRRLFQESALAFNNSFDPYASKTNNENGIGYQLRQALGVNNSFNQTPLNTSYNFSLGNKWSFGNQEIGFTSGLVYSRNFTHYENGNVNTFINAGSDKLFAYQALKETKSVDNPQLGGLANLSYKLNKNHSVGFTGIYTNDAEKVSREQTGSYLGQASDSRDIYNTLVQEFTQRELKTIVANGTHHLNVMHGLDIEWSGSNTQSRQYEPDLRYFAFTSLVDSVDSLDADGNLLFKYQDTVYSMNNAEYKFPFHFYRDLNDEQMQGKIDFTLTLNEAQTTKIKAGVYTSEATRDFKEYAFEMNNSGFTGITLNTFNGNVNDFTNPRNFGIIDTNYNSAGQITSYRPGWHYLNRVNQKNFYGGETTIRAAYLMGVASPIKPLKMIGGARVESTNMFVQTRDTAKVEYVQLNGDTVKDPGRVSLTDILPSLNVVFELNEKTNIRGGYSKTLARPNMRELAPFAQFDPKNGFFNVGNPGLKRTLIDNVDLRCEYYPKPGEIIAVSAYYKLLRDPIIRAFNPRATIPELTFVNVDKAEIMGLEFEFRKSLGFIHDKLSPFSFNANLALIKSRVDVPADEIRNAQNVDSTFSLDYRPFQGQAPYILNLILAYVNAEIGNESALSFNVSGKKLYSISMFATPDIYESPVPMLNFKTSQKIGKYWSLSLSARNILNSEIAKTQIFRGQEYVAESFLLGRTFSLGLSFRLN